MAESLSSAAERGQTLRPSRSSRLRLASNENPVGPAPAALSALLAETDQFGRYPGNSRKSPPDLSGKIAKRFGTHTNNVTLGAGSAEILHNAVRAFTSPQRGLVTGRPSFEQPIGTARLVGSPVIPVALDNEYLLDLDEMARAARGQGLVYLCNPNNPTGTALGHKAVQDFLNRIRLESPETVVLIDEAYCDYVRTDEYRTAIPEAVSRPRVLVSRTFSKAHGMAGLRIGYGVGHEKTIASMERFKLRNNINAAGLAAALASFDDVSHLAAESERNLEARRFTLDFFKEAGYDATHTETNFVFVNLRSPADNFRTACQVEKVFVGRNFAPLEEHIRISIGTLEEMREAVPVFRKVLGISDQEQRRET